jgi:aspartyl protease family protein
MRSLLAVSILIVLAAVAAPKLFARYMEQPIAADVSAPVVDGGEEIAAQRTASSSQVEIKAERDGHFYVDAEINFRPVRLMVDTGATVVALRASDARAAGIHVRDADFVLPVQTANGTTNAAEASLDTISVDGIELHHIRALIIPDDQLSLSLLGGSFLHGLERFEVADGTLIFEN